MRVELLGQHVERAVANPPATPCVESFAGDAGTRTAGRALVAGPYAGTYPSTNVNDNPGALAYARIGDAVIASSPYMTVAGLQSSAVGTCRDGKPAFGGTSNVTRLYTEDRPIELPDEGVPTTIPIPGGTLVVNEKVQTPTSMTRRALRLDTPFFDVVFGESTVTIDSCPVARPTRRALRRASRPR